MKRYKFTLDIKFKYKQWPVLLNIALSVYKAQGQTLQ